MLQRANFPHLCIKVILPYQTQLFLFLTSTPRWRTYGSSQNVMGNGILYHGLTQRYKWNTFLFVLIRSNSSCHKFQQITKERVSRVDKPLEMFVWRIKEGKKTPMSREDIYHTNWDQWSKSLWEVNQNVSPNERKEPPGKEWLHFQIRKVMLHLREKHRSGENNWNVGIAFYEPRG